MRKSRESGATEIRDEPCPICGRNEFFLSRMGCKHCHKVRCGIAQRIKKQTVFMGDTIDEWLQKDWNEQETSKENARLRWILGSKGSIGGDWHGTERIRAACYGSGS